MLDWQPASECIDSAGSLRAHGATSSTHGPGGTWQYTTGMISQPVRGGGPVTVWGLPGPAAATVTPSRSQVHAVTVTVAPPSESLGSTSLHSCWQFHASAHSAAHRDCGTVALPVAAVTVALGTVTASLSASAAATGSVLRRAGTSTQAASGSGLLVVRWWVLARSCQ